MGLPRLDTSNAAGHTIGAARLVTRSRPTRTHMNRLGFPAALAGFACFSLAQAAAPPANAPALFQQYCFECHGGSKAKGDISIERLLQQQSIGAHAENWAKVAEMLETAQMPPPEASEFPPDPERKSAAAWVRAALKTYEARHSG